MDVRSSRVADRPPGAVSYPDRSISDHSMWSPRDAVVFSSFLCFLLAAWAVIPQWAWSTWASRRNPYVRARQPAWLLAEMAYATFTITIICLDEMLRCHGLRLPCRLIKVAAALKVVVVPGLVLWRSLQLWYAMRLRRMKGQIWHMRLFRRAIAAVLLCLAVISASLAVSVPRFCVSKICDEDCFFGSQLFLLLPLHVLGRLLHIITHKLLRAFISTTTDRLGLVSDFKRLYTYGTPLFFVTYLLVLLMDLGAINTEPYGRIAVSFSWLIAIASKFIAIHVQPSIAHGYAPACLLRSNPQAWLHEQGIKQVALRTRRSTRATVIPTVDSHIGEPEAGGRSSRLESAMSPPPLLPLGTAAATALTEDRPSSPSSSDSSPSSRHSPCLSWGSGRESRPSSPEPALGMGGKDPSSMTVDDLLVDDDGLLADFFSYCKSIMCEHMVCFLLILRPYGKHETGSCPQVMPADKLEEMWSVFIRHGAAFEVPLSRGLVQGFRRYCQPRAGDQVKRGRTKLHPISEVEGLGSFARSSRKVLLGNDSDQAAASSTISVLLQTAYAEIETMLAHNVLPQFKTELGRRHSEHPADDQGKLRAFREEREEMLAASLLALLDDNEEV